MPGPCRPIELSMPLGVSAMRGVGRPERGVEHDALGDDGADLGDVEELVELAAGGRAAGRGEHRRGQLERPARSAVMSTSGSGRGASGRGPWVITARVISGLRSRARRACPRGTVPTSSQRTRSPRKTGPSTHERSMRVTPSSPITGSTHVMQTPMPQAIASSTAHWE